jgi:succinate-semialdehyde dehydrogenase/glutarate-semialdehyde dehydrogenase
MYQNVLMYIDGVWMPSATGETLDVVNPVDDEVIGTIPRATRDDLDRALNAAEKGFRLWKSTSAFERSKLMRRAGELLRERSDSIARLMTLEQGKPIPQAKAETLAAADIIDWFAEEGKRTYGRLVPARAPGVYQMVTKEPVGPVAAFTPWNFPINQIVRKLSGALAAGCSIIIKAPQETPASPAELIRAFADAGIPPGVVNLVFGDSAEISQYLIPHPIIQKISFTGSTEIGKRLAALAGSHMKRATMELGGHGPAMVFNDADIDVAISNLVSSKFRNAGQVCVSPTRFIVQDQVFNEFTERFVEAAKKIRVGNGLDPETDMGPLINRRRLAAMEELTADAVANGAKLLTGGRRIGSAGCFFEPTVLANVPLHARAMNEEPFGPMALINSYKTEEEMLAEANRLPYGLAAYAYTRSAKTSHAIASTVASGMISINHSGLSLPEVPFGGIKDSGYGSEGGTEGIEPYMNVKFVSQLDV